MVIIQKLVVRTNNYELSLIPEEKNFPCLDVCYTFDYSVESALG